MSPFSGFPEGKVRLTPLPSQFFLDLLPSIDHLGELKVTLYLFWRLDRMEGEFRYVRRSDFLSDTAFMNGLSPGSHQAESLLDESLERAVGRGTLLAVTSDQDGEVYYFLNSPRGRAAVEAVRQGKWHLVDTPPALVTLSSDRPNIYRLYEENIGPLTPMIAQTLQDAEQLYPPEWIEQAVRIAVENNVRRWHYAEAILRSWKEKGRDEQNRGDTEKDRRRYIEGEFSEFIEH
jgi:DNA replication protein